jgi:hypothetical protein
MCWHTSAGGQCRQCLTAARADIHINKALLFGFSSPSSPCSLLTPLPVLLPS